MAAVLVCGSFGVRCSDTPLPLVGRTSSCSITLTRGALNFQKKKKKRPRHIQECNFDYRKRVRTSLCCAYRQTCLTHETAELNWCTSGTGKFLG